MKRLPALLATLPPARGSAQNRAWRYIARADQPGSSAFSCGRCRSTARSRTRSTTARAAAINTTEEYHTAAAIPIPPDNPKCKAACRVRTTPARESAERLVGEHVYRPQGTRMAED